MHFIAIIGKLTIQYSVPVTNEMINCRQKSSKNSDTIERSSLDTISSTQSRTMYSTWERALLDHGFVECTMETLEASEKSSGANNTNSDYK